MNYQELKEKHPSILKCSIDVGPGWYPIIDELCQEMKDAGYEGLYWAVQIKEKFGGLRFYTNFGCTELYNMVTEAEHRAEKTCEETGRPGSIKNVDGWLKCTAD
jgi:hypothetical protein